MASNSISEQIHSYSCFGAGMVYLFNAFQLYLDYRITRDSVLLNTISLSVSMAIYCALLVAEHFPVVAAHPQELMQLLWIFGVVSTYFYIRSLRLYLRSTNRYGLAMEKAAIPLLVILITGFVFSSLGGPQIFFQLRDPAALTPQTSYQVSAHLVPTGLMNGIALISLTVFLSSWALSFKQAWLRRDHETLILVGMAVTLLAIFTDALQSLGFFATFSYLFMAKGIELIRLVRYYHQKTVLRLTELEHELTQMSRQAALSFVTSGLAHDVKNPLSVILLHVEDLTENELRLQPIEKTSKMVEVVRKNTLRIQEMMASYLGLLGRINQSEPCEVPVRDLIEGAIELCSFRRLNSKIKNIEIIENQALAVLGNRTQLEMLFANLINNALDATQRQDSGWIKITVDGESGHAILRVSNSGSLTTELKKRLFKESISTKGVQGHGIGLRISAALAEANQGKIELEDQAEGVCFKVQLPQGQGLDANQDPGESAA